ncbi:unnamed protein product [Rhizoctonia solani]|uniref:Uncharacterized protein n=1 Tax=Rhizoctonia solani TaxID=456999 RepID=A0A8H3AFI3_9AGAM|nr:unnamed protein product [Rhizoctonia solani]
MSHTQQKLFKQKLLYVAPLGYYALRTLRPWCFGIDADDKALSSWVTVSTAEGDERVNLGDIIAPWAKGDISLLDPATWAFLIRLYNGLPEHYSRYKLALNDPYLPMLSAIPSTANFSIITVLDLSGCDDLHDSNISQLKILTSLCVLDTSCTHLTDQAVRNLMSTLLLQEPGPLRLQSWSLRNCADVTNRSIESLGYFPMLCLLDLRGTKVEPHRSMRRLLSWNCDLLPPQEHFDFFWPQPQFGIPALIQDLKSTAYSITAVSHESDEKLQRPWIVHIDRQYPSDWGLRRRPHWERAPSSNHLPWYQDSYDSDEYYSDGYSDMDMFETDGPLMDGDGFGSGSDSGESFEEAEAEISPDEFDPSSPLEPASSIFEGDENSTSTSSRVDPTSTNVRMNEAASSGTSDSNALSRPVVPTAAPQLSSTELDRLVAEIAAYESAGPAPGVPNFYNPRVQAELAPPKVRKRRRRYSSASSESYDSDEEREKEKKMEAELRRRRMEAISNKDWQLMLLREPPEWCETDTLVTTVRTWKQSRSQNAPAQPDLSSAKKRKVDTSGPAAMWAHIRASRPSGPPNQSAAPHKAKTPSSGTSTQIRPPVAQASSSTLGGQAPARRATLGRAPRPPGTIVRKLR